jgi:PAS domain-containing protein
MFYTRTGVPVKLPRDLTRFAQGFRLPGRQMKMRESLSHALLDVSVDAIVGMDGEGLVVEFNPAAEQLFGYSREQAIGTAARHADRAAAPPQSTRPRLPPLSRDR